MEHGGGASTQYPSKLTPNMGVLGFLSNVGLTFIFLSFIQLAVLVDLSF